MKNTVSLQTFQSREERCCVIFAIHNLFYFLSVVVDRVRFRGQHGVHLEPADEGDSAETRWP